MKVEREAFTKLLDTLKPALASGGGIPELQHIWFDGKFAYAYDGGLGIRLPFEGDLKGGIPGQILIGLVGSTTLKELDLVVTKGDLVIKIGRASTTIVVLPLPEDIKDYWPFPLKPSKDDQGLSLTSEFIAALKFVRVLKPERPVRPEHYGVVLFPSRDFMGLYVTDSRALASIEVAGKYNKELTHTILPFNFVAQLISLGGNGHKVSFASDAIIAELGTAQLCSNLLDSSDVPNMPEAVDQYITGEEEYVEIPELLKEALNRATILNKGSEGFIKLSLNKKELSVTGKFAFGLLNEKMVLTKVGGSGEIVVGLNQIKNFIKAASAFSISNKALVLIGEGSELLIIASHDE